MVVGSLVREDLKMVLVVEIVGVVVKVLMVVGWVSKEVQALRLVRMVFGDGGMIGITILGILRVGVLEMVWVV